MLTHAIYDYASITSNFLGTLFIALAVGSIKNGGTTTIGAGEPKPFAYLKRESFLHWGIIFIVVGFAAGVLGILIS